MKDKNNYQHLLASETCSDAKLNNVSIDNVIHNIHQLTPIDNFGVRDWVDCEIVLTRALEVLSKDQSKEKVQAFARGILRRD